MDFIQLLILAIVQALLEWLPVSSEGFIILISTNIFQEAASVAFTVAIYFHLGTAIAVVIKYWRTYIEALTSDRTILRFLILATLGTAAVGIPLYIMLKEIFGLSGLLVTLFIGITLIVTGLLLRFGRLKATDTYGMDERKVGDEIALGAAQGFAILPGISRSGVTVTYLLVRGFKKEDAFKMSFLISLPAVLGAIAFDILFSGTPLIFDYTYLLLMGVVAVLGFLMMEVLLKLAEKVSFDKICFILGGVTIALVAFVFGWIVWLGTLP